DTAPSVMTVDWRELQRRGISEQNLPPGSVIRFKQPSFWDAYKWYVIGLMSAVIVEAILIAWLLFLRTRRRQAEEESLRLGQLAKAEHKRLNEIVSNVPGIVWETVIDPATKQLRTTFVSDYVRKMLGYTAEEWLAAPPGLGLRIMPQPDRERAERESEAVIASGEEGISQFRWLAKDGHAVWTESYLNPMKEESGNVIGLRGVTLDVTERKAAEEGLRKAEERDRAILNAIPDLMFVQTRDGVYLDYHAKDPKDLLVPSKAFLGKNMRDVLPPELAQQVARCFEDAEEMGEPQILEYKLGMNGTERWFEARMVRSGDNIVSVVRDITQRVRSEAAIKKSEAQLAGIIGSAMDAIITVDASQRIMLFNEAAEKMFGCSQAEAVGALLDRFIPERFRKAHRERLSEFRKRNGSGRLVGTLGELYGVRNSGEEFPMEASISRIDLIEQEFYTIILRDITERKAAEEAVRAERELLDVVVHHLPACVCVIRGSDLRLQIINPAYQAIAPGKEMIGKTLDELWPEAGQNFAAICQRVLETGEPYEVTDELNTIRRMPNAPLESAYFSWSMHRVRLPGGDGWGLLNAGWETTKRKQAEDGLRESEERFGKAFRANPQPMSLTRMADGCYIDVNESFLSVSGYAREEVIGRTSLELNIWETPERCADFIRQLMERGALVNVETKFRTKEGSFRLLLSSAERLDLGGVECLLVASSDITERMLAQQALKESEARFRNMADTAPVMIWVTGADKLCTYVNQQWCDLTGRTMEQELGNGWAERIHPDDYPRCMETYVNAFDRREPFRMEFRVRGADGTFHWVISSGTPRFSPAGEFLGYIGSCMDITDRKESEESLRLAHEEVSSLKNQLQEENIYLKEEIRLQQNFGEIIGESDALKYVLFKIEQVAPTDSTVLITGETGTGKELVAEAIHKASTRADRPLIRVNCAALAASLIESELFGHEKGAFTGALTNKIGRFELANGATIFLDEIGELPPESQGKLLRVIQEGEFERLGSSRTIKGDVRIIAATNRNLDLEVKKGLFREDLWYRLNVFPITVPPLRQRREDIPLLVEHFVSKSAKKLGKVITSVSPATLKSLRDYSWRGNVRELANVIERAVINSQGSVLRIGENFGLETIGELTLSTKTLEEIERDYILRVLEDRAWRIEGRHGAARLLGLNPSTLRTRMIKLGIHRQSLSASATTASRDDNRPLLAGRRFDSDHDRNP
ncbi:MAG: PAS domain S-box protein, partial [Pyrinomonadaceae bacterium]